MEHIQSGSFRFGTLKEYRSQENPGERFSDTREGIAELGIHPENGYFSDAQIGGLHLKNVSFFNFRTPVKISNSFNAYVFCASRGGYSRDEHLTILNGGIATDGSKYSGNLELTHYAVIDLEAFLAASLATTILAKEKQANRLHPDFFRHALVEYGEPQIDLKVANDSNFPNMGMSHHHYLRALFTKPARFSPENEYRVVVQPEAPILLGDTGEALFLKSKALRRSIIRTGSV